jgi:hypothetical protein
MQDAIELDGRKFHGVTQALSAAQDDYILGHLRRSGAMEILTEADGKKRPDEKRAELMLTAILLAGETHHIVAGCVTEVGKKWTREEAIRNAEAFAGLTDSEEKRQMRMLIIHLVIAFFGLGARSQAISASSSSPTETVRPIASAAPSTLETSPG